MCLLLWGAGARSENARSRLLHSPNRGGSAKLPLVLVDVDRQPEIKASRKKLTPGTNEVLLPNRIYWYHNDEDDRWYYIVTNFEGKYPTDPCEFIQQGSVFEGKYLGAKNPEQNYILNTQRLWVPTFRKAQQYYWLRTNVSQRIKSVEYGTIIDIPNTQKKSFK